MTHARPIPDAAKAPYPAHPAPIEPAAEPAATPPAAEPPAGASTLAKIGVGAAIGSAAIAAALLYVNHGRKR